MAARRTPGSLALEIGGTAVAAALSPRLLPRLPTRRRLVRRLLLGTVLGWVAHELRTPERQAKLATHQAELWRERNPERVDELRRRLGRDPLDEEVVAFLQWES